MFFVLKKEKKEKKKRKRVRKERKMVGIFLLLLLCGTDCVTTVMNSRWLRALSDVLVANLKLRMQCEWTVCVSMQSANV